MSTKIHNGYYINLTDLNGLQRFIIRLRKRMMKVQTELYARKLVKLMVKIFDTRTLTEAGYYDPEEETEENKHDKDHPAGSVAYWKINDRYQKTQGEMQRDIDYDLTCKVTAIITKTKILLLIHAEQTEFHEAFRGMKGVHGYGYQNSTDDVPKGVTRQEFKTRGWEWDRAVSAENEFDIQCTGMFLPHLEMDEVFKLYQIPEFEKRLNLHAKEIVSNQFFKRTIKEDKVQLTEIVPHVSDWRKYMESEGGIAEIEKMKAELRTVLKNPLTQEDLLKEPET